MNKYELLYEFDKVIRLVKAEGGCAPGYHEHDGINGCHPIEQFHMERNTRNAAAHPYQENNQQQGDGKPSPINMKRAEFVDRTNFISDPGEQIQRQAATILNSGMSLMSENSKQKFIDDEDYHWMAPLLLTAKNNSAKGIKPYLSNKQLGLLNQFVDKYKSAAENKHKNVQGPINLEVTSIFKTLSKATDYIDCWTYILPNGRELSQLDYEDHYALKGGQKLPPQDSWLNSLITERGWDAKPQVVDSATIDQAIASGDTEVWRGIKDPTGNFSKEFKFGKYFIGRGIYGNGVYTTNMKETAESYAKDEQGRMHQPPMRMALNKNAKVVTEQELEKAKEEYQRNFFSKMQGKLSPEAEQNLMMLFDDNGRAATLLGYDAYVVSPDIGLAAGVRENYYVVLNRGALMVEE